MYEYVQRNSVIVSGIIVVEIIKSSKFQDWNEPKKKIPENDVADDDGIFVSVVGIGVVVAWIRTYISRYQMENGNKKGFPKTNLTRNLMTNIMLCMYKCKNDFKNFHHKTNYEQTNYVLDILQT